MNRHAPEPLVITAAGGKGGGRKLTVAGKQAIKFFWELSIWLQDFLEKETQAAQEAFGR